MGMNASDAIDELERKIRTARRTRRATRRHRALVRRNKEAPRRQSSADGDSLPFVLIQTRQDAEVDVEISEDVRKVHFDFNQTPFQIHDGFHVLTKMINTSGDSSVDERPRRDGGDGGGGGDGGADADTDETTQLPAKCRRRQNLPRGKRAKK